MKMIPAKEIIGHSIQIVKKCLIMETSGKWYRGNEILDFSFKKDHSLSHYDKKCDLSVLHVFKNW